MMYYFNIRDAFGVIPDEEGSDLADMVAARREARESANDLMMDDLRGGRPALGLQIEIVDATGLLLEAVALDGNLLLRFP
jgi:hypothetical protein